MLEQQFGTAATWREPDDVVVPGRPGHARAGRARPSRVLHAPGHTEGSVMFALPTVPDGVADSGLGSTLPLRRRALRRLHRSHRPARRQRRGDDPQPARRGPAAAGRHPGPARPRPRHHRSSASAPRTPTCKDCQREPEAESPRSAASPSGCRATGSWSSTSWTSSATPSSCTASPRSRPGRSSRSSGSLRKGEDADKEIYVDLAACRRPGRRRPRGPAGAALRPHRPVRALRAGERRQAAVPVPPLPDPEGVARRAAAGGPLPRVHPGRHRHRRRRYPAGPLRGRAAAGHRRRASASCRSARSGSRSTTARSPRASTSVSG